MPGLARVGFLGRDGLAGEQLRGAVGLALHVVEPHLRLDELRLATVELGLVPARINDEKHVAPLDELAGLEAHFLDVAGHARADLDVFHRRGAAGELVPLDQFALFDHRDGHGRRRHLLGRGGA